MAHLLAAKGADGTSSPGRGDDAAEADGGHSAAARRLMRLSKASAEGGSGDFNRG